MNFLYQLFSEDLIYALGWTVLHSFWQALAIGLLMAVGMMLLQNKSAKARYEMAAFSMFLVLISALTTFLVYFDTAQSTTDFVTVHLQEVAGGNAAAEMAIATSSIENYMQYFNQHIPLVVAIWFVGVCFFLVRLMGGLAYVQRLKYTNNKPVSVEWTNKVKLLCRKLRLRRPVKMVESSLATVPMVIGYLKPVILMPIGAINGLSESEVDAIIAHELAHVYRNDFLLNIFLSVIEVLFYFNPAVWWIAANVRTERENCCDDIAIKLCGNSLAYAKALLSLQELSQSVPGYAMAFAGPKNQLLQRIKRILSQPRTKSNMLEKFTATCFLMVTMVLFSIGANSYNYNKNIQQQFFANEMTALMAAEEDKEEGYFAFSMEADTTPKNKKQRYIKKSDDGEVELEIEEGDITKLTVDGEEVPKAELEEYDEMINELIEEMEAVPTLKQHHFTTQHSCNHKHANAPNCCRKKTITTEIEDDGRTRIIVQNIGEEPTEIILNEKQEYIFIDGTRLEGGDTVVIIDEKGNAPVLGQKNVLMIDPGQSFDLEDLAGLEEELQESLKQTDISVNDLIEVRIVEMEKQLEELRNRQIEVQVYSEKLRTENLERHNKMMEEHRVAQRQALEEQAQQSIAQREAISEQAEARKEQQNAALERLALLDDINWEDAREQPGINFNNHIKNILLDEMIRDGLVTDKDDYSFELTKKRLKVNGKKQSKEISKKYLKLYERNSGKEMNEGAEIRYKNKNGNAQSSFRSSGVFEMKHFEEFSYLFLVNPEPFKMSSFPKRIEGLESLPFQITPVKFNFNFNKVS
ncbi:MAG: M56 family metallopeptidase [Saprospiraceae bacterium]